MIGTTISHYRILEKLGGGGMGVVYKAEDLKLGRVVALKFLPPELSHDEDAKLRFMREARAASALDHPNICTIFEIGEADDGRLFIAMAYYRGESLKKRIERGPLPTGDAVRIATQVADGLATAHEHKIIHRDIKPANIMLLDEGGVKIVDFGLAKLADEVSITGTGVIVGTPAYMSPEQIRGGEVGEKADLWALGVVLHEMVMGKKPGEGNSNPPQELTNTLHSLLQRDSGRRPASARDVAANLRSLSELSNTPTVSRDTHAARPTRRVMILAAVLAITVIAATSWVAHRRNDRRRAPSGPTPVVAVFPFTVRGSDGLAYLREGMVDLLSSRLDGVTGIRTVDPAFVLNVVKEKATIDREAAKDLAARLGATHVVLGSITASGGTIRANATLLNADGEREESSETTVHSEKEIFDLVDQLAMRLLTFRPTASDVRLAKVAATNTGSFEGLKAYLEGEREARAGNLTRAEEFFRKAVGHDAAFALAWYRLSMTQAWQFKATDALKSNQNALQHINRLAERDQQFLRGWDAFLRGYGDEAERIIRTAVSRFPDDVQAWHLLAETQFHLNNIRGHRAVESREANERLLQLVPDHSEAWSHLYLIAAIERDRAALDRISRRTIDLFPKDDFYRTAREFYFGDRQRLIEQLRQSGRLGDSAYDLTYLSFTDGDLQAFGLVNRYFLEHEHLPSRALGWIDAAFVDLGRGRWKAAVEKLKQADDLDRSSTLSARVRLLTAPFLPLQRAELLELRKELIRWKVEDRPQADRDRRGAAHAHIRSFLLGLVEARLGDRAALEKRIEDLQTLPPLPPVFGSLAEDCVQILRALDAQNPHDALRQMTAAPLARVFYPPFTAAFPVNPHSKFVRAELLDRNGLVDQAARWYESLIDVASASSFSYQAAALYRLAECHERLGRPADAAREYATFIELWKDCDPELRPMVEKARARLAALRERAPATASVPAPVS